LRRQIGAFLEQRMEHRNELGREHELII
jgi:hypothetical protein